MPTWFCSRDLYNRVGGFDEGGKVTYHFPYLTHLYQVDCLSALDWSISSSTLSGQFLLLYINVLCFIEKLFFLCVCIFSYFIYTYIEKNREVRYCHSIL